MKNAVEIVLDGKTLYVANHGRKFDRLGVISVCASILSSKAVDVEDQPYDHKDVADGKLIEANGRKIP